VKVTRIHASSMQVVRKYDLDYSQNNLLHKDNFIKIILKIKSSFTNDLISTSKQASFGVLW
jgi:hypothetical protein